MVAYRGTYQPSSESGFTKLVIGGRELAITPEDTTVPKNIYKQFTVTATDKETAMNKYTLTINDITYSFTSLKPALTLRAALTKIGYNGDRLRNSDGYKVKAPAVLRGGDSYNFYTRAFLSEV